MEGRIGTLHIPAVLTRVRFDAAKIDLRVFQA